MVKEKGFSFIKVTPEYAFEKLKEILKGGGVGEGGGVFLLIEAPSGSLLQEIKNYIDAHFPELKGISLVAEHFNITPVTLIREFKKVYGMTPCAYLRNLRREYALLLREKGYLWKEIADRLGYSSPSHVIRLISGNKKSKSGKK